MKIPNKYQQQQITFDHSSDIDFHIKKSYKNNKCKLSAPTWNKEFE